MANNIFLDKNQYVPPTKRNAYDLSHLVNGTWKCGLIYPVDWHEVTFGDALRTKIRAAIRTMPMVWPIQTPIYAKFYQFYVRYRTIWKQFEDFRFGNKQLVHPYLALDNDADFWKTGNLFDWLNGPTTYAADHYLKSLYLYAPTLDGVSPRTYPVAFQNSSILGNSVYAISSYETPGLTYGQVRFLHPNLSNSLFDGGTMHISANMINLTDLQDTTLYIFIYRRINAVAECYFKIDDITELANEDGSIDIDLTTGIVTFRDSSTINTGLKGAYDLLKEDGDEYFFMLADKPLLLSVGNNRVLKDTNFTLSQNKNLVSCDLGHHIYHLEDVANPFAGSSPVEPLTSLPARAYEAIYNSHFRDPINEPFVVDGEVQYNRYVTTDEGGPDFTDYKLYHRNWEADAFTSAKPSPQQGIAPIVGITSSGDITLQRQDGGEYTVRLRTDENGVVDSYEVTQPGQQGDASTRRTLLDLATSGFTIERLREVNAYQKFKEAVYRRSPRYKDQALSVFGVNLRYDELDMPEFLGGFTLPLNVNIINQTSSSVEDFPLGGMAGNGGFYGESAHSFQRYCDEEGIVMTLMCITPIPVYSQMLSRNWIRNTPLDYYNPQFGKIGNQPITYEEVCPVQAYNEGVDLHDVFGYQRPWYHMITSFDTVHGEMRDGMNGFCFQRIFGSTPELGASFLHIDQTQLNDVFVVQHDGQDTFYGQIAVDQRAKKPIPRKNVPSLV